MRNPEWIKYTGTDEQIKEIVSSIFNSGFCLRYNTGQTTPPILYNIYDNGSNPYFSIIPSHKLICEPHPLADMARQQMLTGQPVWIKTTDWTIDLQECEGQITSDSDEHYMIFITNTPDWNIPSAESIHSHHLRRKYGERS